MLCAYVVKSGKIYLKNLHANEFSRESIDREICQFRGYAKKDGSCEPENIENTIPRHKKK